jgi:hypothetical protein
MLDQAACNLSQQTLVSATNVSATRRRTFQRLAEKIIAIQKAIRKFPEVDLAEPSIMTDLPFPSPLSIPFQRFDWRLEDSIPHFSYMGRSILNVLYKQMQGPNFLAAYEALYLYGSSGSGKSHIIAALVCRLIREGKHVLYIPDCSKLLNDFTRIIRSALQFAFYDSKTHLKVIESAQVEGLLAFWANQGNGYLIVDQVNALDLGSPTTKMDDIKKQVTHYLARMQVGHKYVFSASANEQSNQMAKRKQSGVTVITMNGGMTEVC